MRPAIDSLRAASLEYERDRAHYLAMSMIYYVVICLVPTLLLLLSTLGLLLRYSSAATTIERQMLSIVESRFGAQLAATVTTLLDIVQRGSVAATIIGLAGMLVTASVLFRRLRLAFRALWNYESPLTAGPLRTRVLTLLGEWGIAFVIMLGGGGLLLVALVLTSAFTWIIRVLDRVPVLPVGPLLALVSSYAVAALAFGALLKVLPPRSVRWRDVLPALLLCAAVWVVASELIPLYHRLVGERRSAYNAIGALLPLLILANIGARTLFFGAELCKVATRRREAARAIEAETRAAAAGRD